MNHLHTLHHAHARVGGGVGRIGCHPGSGNGDAGLDSGVGLGLIVVDSNRPAGFASIALRRLSLASRRH